MENEIKSYQAGAQNGRHFYRELRKKGEIELYEEMELWHNHAKYLLSKILYSVTPKEWMTGFEDGWNVAKEKNENKK